MIIELSDPRQIDEAVKILNEKGIFAKKQDKTKSYVQCVVEAYLVNICDSDLEDKVQQFPLKDFSSYVADHILEKFSSIESELVECISHAVPELCDSFRKEIEKK